MDTDLALEALVGHQSVAQLFGEKGLSPGRHFTYLHFSFPICKARVIMGPAPSGLSRGAEALIVEIEEFVEHGESHRSDRVS
jgi:hypothetical protein